MLQTCKHMYGMHKSEFPANFLSIYEDDLLYTLPPSPSIL